jgi:peptidoglycan hydrolase-like protein with peptidoglycan-binding domain
MDDLPTSGTGDNLMMRKLIVGTAAVLALGIGGAALDFGADADDVPNAVGNSASAPGTSYHWLNAANLSKDDIRWAQVELHMIGLYNGSLDGVAGSATKRALLAFQESNGLDRTATLDQQTADALIGNTGTGHGSSMPPKGAGAGPMTNSSGTSNFGSRTGQ